MQTHRDIKREFMEQLRERAADDSANQRSQITAGADGEEILAQWKARGVSVVKRPDDEQGILRISIGGGPDTPVALNYCVFRGNHAKCVDLLRKALVAMQEGPEE